MGRRAAAQKQEESIVDTLYCIGRVGEQSVLYLELHTVDASPDQSSVEPLGRHALLANKRTLRLAATYVLYSS